MKKELIKTENYLLVVDDSEIKDVRPYKGKWHLEKGYILNKFPVYLTDLSYCKIIIAHLPLNDSPILEGVSLLPPLDEGVFITPTYFEFEMEDDFSKNNDEYIDELGAKGNYHTHLKIIKTTTNSQGQQVACGKYLFEL